jgi:hypothetical protein
MSRADLTPALGDGVRPEADPIRLLIDERVPWAIHGSVFSRQSFGAGPMLAQGWKLHVSAAPSSAVPVLDAALEVLIDEGVRFKVVNSTDLLTMLNAGHLGLSQIGKYITVYPSDNAQAVRLATALDRATSGGRGPRVPTDRPLRPDSLVHYRYGGMHHGPEADTGNEGPVGDYDLLDPGGRLTNDFRLHYYLPPPAEIADPFETAGAYVPRPARSLLLDGRYLVVNGLSQGLRGGVFRAIDLGATPARFCLLKEAWHDVSVDQYGRDARDWLVNEERILVRHEGRPLLPRFYGSFDLDNNRYIAIEYIEGTTLAQALSDRHSIKDGLGVAEIIAVGRETASALAQLHELGLVFRDFSPANVIATPDGRYRLIDFGNTFDVADYGAVPIGGGTPPFYPREQFDREPPAPADDVFAWGAVLHYLCCGGASVADIPEEDYGLRPFARRPVTESRPDFPQRIAAVIDRALAWERKDRYATMREAQRAFLQAAEGPTARPPRAPAVPREHPAAPDMEGPAGRAMSRAELTGLAREVGDALCAEAEERDGEGLYWAARDELSNRTAYGPDLYSGAAGIGLFLAELSRATGEPRYADAARGAARWLAGPTWGRGRAQHGLHCGEPGISYFFLSLAELLDEPGFVTAAELRMRRLHGVPFATVDLTHGAAGTILALVNLHRVTGESVYLAAARTAGDELVQTALSGFEGCPGCYWDVAPGAPGESSTPYLGLLHGAAGIGLALAHLAGVSGDERYLDVARGTAELLRAQARSSPATTSEAGDSDNDGLTWPRRLGDDAPGLQAHCHGAGGIGQFFLHLDRLVPDPRYRDAARRAALTILAQRRHESRSCLCHGLAGTGHLLLDCYQAFGESRWLELALECGLQLQRFRAESTGVYGMSLEGLASPDLMLGYAGVGSLLIRLVNPKTSEEIVLGRAVTSPGTRREQVSQGGAPNARERATETSR